MELIDSHRRHRAERDRLIRSQRMSILHTIEQPPATDTEAEAEAEAEAAHREEPEVEEAGHDHQ